MLKLLPLRKIMLNYQKKNIDDINFLEIDLIIKDEENLINFINPILNEKY